MLANCVWTVAVYDLKWVEISCSALEICMPLWLNVSNPSVDLPQRCLVGEIQTLTNEPVKASTGRL